MNIRNIVIKHKLVAFECNSHTHFKYFIDQCKNEGIKFSKTGFVEDYDYLYKYSDGSDCNYKLYALIVLSGYHQPRKESYIKRMDPLLQEFQFYSRSDKDKDIYTDWSKYTMVDFSQMLRDSKLDIILKDI